MRASSVKFTTTECGNSWRPPCRLDWPMLRKRRVLVHCPCAARTSKPAYWASWSDSLAMIHRRQTTVADQLVHQTPVLGAAADARRELIGVMGFEPPSWQAMSHGARPPHREPEDVDEACSRVERRHRRDLFSHTLAQVRALIRSQGGGGAGAVLSVAPTSRETTLPPHLFRVILLRRLRQALPLCARWCRCGSSRRVCTCRGAQSEGVYFGECSCENLQRSPGTRSHQSMVRDMDVPAPDVHDGRRLEVVVDLLQLRGGPNWPSTRQWCVHCTVMALHDDKLPSAMGLH